MKLMLLIIVVILCTAIGYLYGEEFKNRYVQLKELMRVIIDLQNEILYAHTPIPEALDKIALKTKEPVNSLLGSISQKLMNNQVSDIYTAFNESINEHRKQLSLQEGDYNILLDLSKSLGETSIYGQESIFQLAKEKLSGELDISYEESKRNTKVYRSLGVGIGLMIAIFLI